MPSTAPRELVLPAGLAEAIVRHCAASLPNEGCGLLGGRRDGRALVARRWFPGTNVLASPSRFAMDHAEVVAALEAIEREGARLVAIVHSHPVTGASPSTIDLREAYYPEALALIVSFAGPEPVTRAWWLDRTARTGSGLPTPVEAAVRLVDEGAP